MNVFLIAAITADGFIAETRDQVSTSWTSDADKKWFRQRTKEAGVVVMGSTTFKTVGRTMPNRLNIIYSRSTPTTEIPVAGNGDLSVPYFTNKTPQALVEELKDKNYSEIAICGGSSIYSMFIDANAIDKIYLTIEPVLFGQGLGVFSEEITKKLHLNEVIHLSDQTLMLEYDVINDA